MKKHAIIFLLANLFSIGVFSQVLSDPTGNVSNVQFSTSICYTTTTPTWNPDIFVANRWCRVAYNFETGEWWEWQANKIAPGNGAWVVKGMVSRIAGSGAPSYTPANINELCVNAAGTVYAWNGSTWVAGSGGGGSATDLGYTQSTRVLTSSTGADVTLPTATNVLPGLLPAPSGLGSPGGGVAPASDLLVLGDASSGLIAAPTVNEVVQSVAAGGDVSGAINNLQLGTGVVTTSEILDATIAWGDLATPVKDSIRAGGGGTTNATVKKLPASIFSDKFSPREAEIKKYVADSTITTGTTLVYSPPVIDSRQRHIIRKNENYNAFPAFMRGSKGELFAYARVGDDHLKNGDAVLYKSTNNGLVWDSVMIRNWTGSPTGYGYGSGAIFERNDTIFVTTQVSYYTGSVLDSASSYSQFSTNRGVSFSSPVWVTKPYASSFFFSEGKSIVLPSGKVLMPVYGSNTPGSTLGTMDVRVGIIQPTGNFSTISYVDIPDGPGGETETELVWVGNDSIIAFIRQENNQTINRSLSTNGGATWSVPVEITIGSTYIAAFPHIEMLPNRRLIMHTRNTLNESWVGYATSDDLGLTWSMYVLPDEATVGGLNYSMYMDFELLSPNLIGAVYAREWLGTSDRNCELKYTTFHIPTQFTYRNDGSKITTIALSASEVNSPSSIMTMTGNNLKSYAVTGTLTPNYLPYATASKVIAPTGIYFDAVNGKYLIGATTDAAANKLSITDVTTNFSSAGGFNRDYVLNIKQTVTPSANSSINYSGLGVMQEISGNSNTGGALYPASIKGTSIVLSGTGTHSQVVGGDFLAQYASTTTGTNTNLYGIKGLAASSAGNVANSYGVFGGSVSGNTALNSYSLYAADARGATNAYGLYIATQNVATNKHGIYQQGTGDLNHIFGPTALGGTAGDGRLTRFSINGTFAPSTLAGAWGTLLHFQNGSISDPTTTNGQTTAERSIVKVSNGIAFASPSFTGYTVSDGYGLLLNPPIAGTNTTITRPWGLGVNGNVKLFNKLAVGAVTSPTAQVHIGPNSVTNNSAPIKLTPIGSALMTTAEVGSIETLQDSLYYTQITSMLRKRFAFNGERITTTNLAYDATTWNGNNTAPTRDDVRDKIETLAPIASPTFTGTATIPTLAMTGRLLGSQGTDVASASDLTLGDGNLFYVTGTTDITAISTAGWTNGSEITLRFQGVLNLINNTAGGAGTAVLRLENASNIATTAEDNITFKLTSAGWMQVAPIMRL